jgi:hypothetical protein
MQTINRMVTAVAWFVGVSPDQLLALRPDEQAELISWNIWTLDDEIEGLRNEKYPRSDVRIYERSIHGFKKNLRPRPQTNEKATK